MEYSIPISKQNIFESIRQITGYTGRGEGENVDKIAVTEDEDSIINHFAEKSMNDFLSNISQFSPTYSSNVIKVILPRSFNQKIIPLLSKAIEDLIVNATSSSWFLMARMPDDVKKYESMALDCFQNTLKLLCSRNKPI